MAQRLLWGFCKQSTARVPEALTASTLPHAIRSKEDFRVGRNPAFGDGQNHIRGRGENYCKLSLRTTKARSRRTLGVSLQTKLQGHPRGP